MINRALIRIKVVQLLYSYLLVEKPFSVESQPSAPTKEKRFAYSLYLDTLLMLAKVAERIYRRDGIRPLYDTRFIQRILADDRIKALVRKYESEPFPLNAIVDSVAESLKDSGLYKKFLKSGIGVPSEEDNIWPKVFELFVANNSEYNAVCSRRENFTSRGMDRMKGMIAETFKSFFASADHLPDALKELEKSMGLSRKLYFSLLQLPIELTFLRERQLDDARLKYIKTDEDINPNMRFVDNEFVRALRENPELRKGVEEYKVSWSDDEILLRSLLKNIMDSDIYRDYMEFPATNFIEDCTFWRNIYKYIILQNPDLLEALEDKSVFWNDDLDSIGAFVIKTVRRFMDGEAEPLFPMYKDEEDEKFGYDLFSAVINRKESYRGMIDSVIDRNQWEYERLAFMDVVIIMTALAEILNFPSIPLTVSFNEYIEIAKSYSSPKSGRFVNGLLGDVVDKLIADGKLFKQ
ncbi:MAG: transcription antitermination protein NusB [Clostridium sp.]|nr:transcription antitermination protein NusB [Prevotella sp.]MCM1428220.1 transcription antitermination protein NusB [Clostridium sp.]MCM1475950.1 transcription antitermination protein NusB [Muribaculaceae bacterium]